MNSVLLTNATLADGRVVDVGIADGVIEQIGAPDPTARASQASRRPTHDLSGWLLLPAAVEPHAHLDKAMLAERLPNPSGDLLGAIAAMVVGRASITLEDTIERAERTARLQAANGYRAVRTHVDVVVEGGLTSVEALVEVRRRVSDVIDVEIVALCGCPTHGAAAADQLALLEAALDAGADVVGGCPHLETDIRASTETLLEIAARRGCAVDLHTDETLELDRLGLRDLAEIVLATGFPHQVTASHSVSLGMHPEAVQREVAELVAEAGIGVVALPQTNLFLQGRAHQVATPRGVTAVRVLREAGVTVAAGADNIQDPFNPVGKACPFEIAGLMILIAHQLPAEAWEGVSTAAGAVTRFGAQTIDVGQPADLLAVHADSLRASIATGGEARRVYRAGLLLD